ncbi:MAG: NIPSNAP family protein [Daejeonella sp.]|uniref:NIPSNAP family protein n=1 Tax=Daejeonella sp. TaxID=2805397 RepID=UPI003C729713
MKLKFIATLAVLISSICIPQVFSQSKKTPFYEIKVYHFENAGQEELIDNYLKNALLPAMNRKGIKNVGVFKPVNNNTSEDKRIYVLVPFKSTKQFTDMPEQLAKDAMYNENGKAYLDVAYNKAPYKRMESIFIKAFDLMPNMELPALKNELSKRVYELRSYEGPTEKMYTRKVEMFNTGGEISLFKRLGFNAVFYGSVIAGSRMPNLMYMTTFEDMAARDEHWNTFRVDEEWKKLSAMDYYKNTVSRNETILLNPTGYSQI